MGLILCTPVDSNYLTLKYYGRFMIELEASISHHIELSGMYAIFQYPVVKDLTAEKEKWFISQGTPIQTRAIISK